MMQQDEWVKGIRIVTFKNCAPFTKCISRKNNTDIDNAQDIDIEMSMHNLVEYSDNYSKHLEVFGNTIKMIQMITYQTLNHLNIK